MQSGALIDNESKPGKLLLYATWLLVFAVFFWGLGDIALLSFNEARRALPARTMFQHGDWLLPHLNGELYLTKPPLIYWLSACAAHLFGNASEWAVRLPSALAGLATIAMVYRYALKQFGAWPALFSAQILIANVTFAMFARRAEIEMLLTALCAGALLAAIHYIREGNSRRWIYLSYLLLGLAMLTKGPLVLLFVTLPLFIVAIYRKDSRCWHLLGSPLGWTIFALVGLSWYALVTWRLGSDIWASIAQRDMVEKMQGEDNKPLWSYFFWILVDFLPVALLLFIKPLNIWQRCKGRTDYLVLLAAVLVPLLIFSLFNNKHAKYLLPAYPMLALLFSMRMGEIFAAARPYRRRAIILVGLLLPSAYFVYYAFAEAQLYNYRVAVFPQFHSWSSEPQPAPLYAYREIDTRIIYYSALPIKILEVDSFKSLKDSHTPMLLLVENAYVDEVKTQADCLVKEFKPYLKKDKALTVYGFGSACSADNGGH